MIRVFKKRILGVFRLIGLRKWRNWRNFKGDSNDGNLSKVRYSIVAANNHYAGFGPGTVNIFRQLLGLEEVKWGDDYVSIDDLEKEDKISGEKKLIKTKQTSLSDYFK